MAEHDHAGHPGEWEYIKIAIILAIVTAAEVGVYYVSQLQSLLVPILMVMMVVKFVLVALWFMHLKFDSKLFRRLFQAGIIFAIGVYSVVLLTLGR